MKNSVTLCGTATVGTKGQIVLKTGRYKILLVGGFAVSAIATFSLSFVSPDSMY